MEPRSPKSCCRLRVQLGMVMCSACSRPWFLSAPRKQRSKDTEEKRRLGRWLQLGEVGLNPGHLIFPDQEQPTSWAWRMNLVSMASSQTVTVRPCLKTESQATCLPGEYVSRGRVDAGESSGWGV